MLGRELPIIYPWTTKTKRTYIKVQPQINNFGLGTETHASSTFITLYCVFDSKKVSTAYLCNRFPNNTDQSNNFPPGDVINKHFFYKALEMLWIHHICKPINHAEITTKHYPDTRFHLSIFKSIATLSHFNFCLLYLPGSILTLRYVISPLVLIIANERLTT